MSHPNHPRSLTVIASLILAVVALAGLHAATAQPERPASYPPFSFLVLGDMHFDHLEHHNRAWLEREHPNDVRQVQNYSELTRTMWPLLFEELRRVVAEVTPPAAFAAQLGDFVEGLCGSPTLARQQCEEAVAFVRRAGLGVPFLITKGNHDITGPGAREAYDGVVLPFLREQANREIPRASFAFQKGDALFAFFDAYDPDSLDWLERTLAERSARHVFVLLHPPVVPFGARSLWHLYWRPDQQPQREHMRELLGKHRAIVLSAHLHRYGVVVRKTREGSNTPLDAKTASRGGPYPSRRVRTGQTVSRLLHDGRRARRWRGVAGGARHRLLPASRPLCAQSGPRAGGAGLRVRRLTDRPDAAPLPLPGTERR